MIYSQLSYPFLVLANQKIEMFASDVLNTHVHLVMTDHLGSTSAHHYHDYSPSFMKIIHCVLLLIISAVTLILNFELGGIFHIFNQTHRYLQTHKQNVCHLYFYQSTRPNITVKYLLH